jgi:hypothetical protein
MLPLAVHNAIFLAMEGGSHSNAQTITVKQLSAGSIGNFLTQHAQQQHHN